MARAKGKDGLTDGQKKYCQGRADGMTKTDAYRAAYNTDPGTNRKTSYRKARDLETGPAGGIIQAYIERLQRETDHGRIATRENIAAALASIAFDDTAPRGDRMRAADLLNRMAGAYIDRHETTIKAAVSMQDAEKAAFQALAGFNGPEA